MLDVEDGSPLMDRALELIDELVRLAAADPTITIEVRSGISAAPERKITNSNAEFPDKWIGTLRTLLANDNILTRQEIVDALVARGLKASTATVYVSRFISTGLMVRAGDGFMRSLTLL